MTGILKEGYYVHKGKDSIILPRSERQLSLPAIDPLVFRTSFYTFEKLNMLFGKKAVHRGADNFFLILYLQQLQRAVVTVCDDQALCIQNKHAVQRSIIYCVAKLLFL